MFILLINGTKIQMEKLNIFSVTGGEKALYFHVLGTKSIQLVEHWGFFHQKKLFLLPNPS